MPSNVFQKMKHQVLASGFQPNNMGGREREREKGTETERTKFYKKAVLGKNIKNTAGIHLRISSMPRKISAILETVFNMLVCP